MELHHSGSFQIMKQDDLTSKQSDSAIFLPAISGFYATFIGKQRVNNDYVDPARMPSGIKDMEQLNWLNSQKSLFPYRWSLYSGGHANLDLSKPDASEDMVRDREPGSFILGDSGGFQIAKGVWPGEWRDPTSADVQNKLKSLAGQKKIVKNKKGKTVEIDLAKEYQSRIDAAQQKRSAVLTWLDHVSDYAMILDIPTWVIYNYHASQACGINTLQEAVDATKYNNEYFMKHRRGIKNGGTKFLNVLQGENHSSAEAWYQTMKVYCDPKVYPDTHFNGWAMGGQNMCDVHLILKRLVALRHDGLLQEGIHDWMHFLGTSKLEWAVLLTDIQRAVRKYVNPKFTISFDCASPFLATANGQMYYQIDLPNRKKWSYKMKSSIDDRKFHNDTRTFRDAVLQEGIFPHFEDSPVSQHLLLKDVCIYQPGAKNKVNKEGKTSWDSFSYALMMAHNVWMHIESVQRANRDYDAGNYPAMMQQNGGEYSMFRDIVEAIFATDDRSISEEIIEHYDNYWMEIIGTRGFKGKNTKNASTMSNRLFVVNNASSQPTNQSGDDNE